MFITLVTIILDKHSSVIFRSADSGMAIATDLLRNKQTDVAVYLL
jgi:hypothetical protein